MTCADILNIQPMIINNMVENTSFFILKIHTNGYMDFKNHQFNLASGVFLDASKCTKLQNAKMYAKLSYIIYYNKNLLP